VPPRQLREKEDRNQKDGSKRGARKKAVKTEAEMRGKLENRK